MVHCNSLDVESERAKAAADIDIFGLHFGGFSERSLLKPGLKLS